MSRTNSFVVREIGPEDSQWLAGILIEHWSAVVIARCGQLIDASLLPGFVAEAGGEPIGLLTYRIDGDQCEVVTLNSLQEGSGVGSALLERAVQAARRNGCTRLWLITTNDNLDAIRFYSRRGMRLVAVHLNALDESRKLKPTIPRFGHYDLPIQDELEFEFILG